MRPAIPTKAYYGLIPGMSQPSYLQAVNNLYSVNRQSSFQTMGVGQYNVPAITYYHALTTQGPYGMSPQTLYGMGGSYIGGWNFLG